MKKTLLTLLFLVLAVFLLFLAGEVFAHLPRIIYGKTGAAEVKKPEISQAFYDELLGSPRDYLLQSDKEFNFYINLLVPQSSNFKGRYSAKVFRIEKDKEIEIAFIDGQTNFEWQEFYEEFGRDYYLKGPEFEKRLEAGDYKITIFNYENKGKYVLVTGKNEEFSVLETLKIYWTLPQLKIQFFKTSVFEFLLTPFGLVAIGVFTFVLLIFLFFILFSSAKDAGKKVRPKMILLTSSGMKGSKPEIMALLQKPAEDVRIAHIITASKVEPDISYVEKDKDIMKETGFNVEDIDIEGKSYSQLMGLLQDMDIIYVQGGNSFYLLRHMRQCNFKKILKKLLKKGVIYVGVSAGSIVMGRTTEPAVWLGDANDPEWQYPKEKFGLTNLKGLKFVPFNIFVHYNGSPEHIEIIRKQSKKTKKNLKILTDQQALLIYESEMSLVGRGEAVNPLNL